MIKDSPQLVSRKAPLQPGGIRIPFTRLKYFKLPSQISSWILDEMYILTAKAQRTQRFNYFGRINGIE
jgi:hypothetical protein